MFSRFGSGAALPREFPVDAVGVLCRGGVRSLYLKVLTRADYSQLDRVRASNRDWLTPWDATSPYPEEIPSFATYVSQMLRATRRGECLPLGIVANGQLVGYVGIADVVRGSAWSASIGYWIAREWGGLGIMTACVAAALDICFTQLRLHRVEICIRPENIASLAVVRKLCLRDEGVRRAYLHINGQWADHRCFALCADEVGESGVLGRLIAARSH